MQQQGDAQRNLRVEASMLADDTSAEKDDLNIFQTQDAQRQLYNQEAGEGRYENMKTLPNHLKSQLQKQSLESFNPTFRS